MSARKIQNADVDDFLDEALSTAAQTFGVEKVYVAAEHCKSLTVIPVKPLCLQWLIESNGWPLGRITQSGGPFGTHKSSFIFQLISWYLDVGGIAALVDTENKTSDSLLRSMIAPKYFDPADPAHKRFLLYRASTVNEWQQMISQNRRLMTEWVEKHGMKFPKPVLVAVDSMLGATSEEGLEQVRSEGEAGGRGYSDTPILISQYMRTMSDALLKIPMTLHMSHHEKPALGTPGMVRAGGKAPDFYATLDIQFKRGGVSAMGKSMEFDRAALQSKNITLSIRKSSMGSDVGKDLVVSFCWRFEGTQQISWWDWDATTAMLLAEKSTAIKDIMDINHSQKQITGEIFWSDTLGVKKENALSARDFGALIENNDALKTALADALHVRRYPILTAAENHE